MKWTTWFYRRRLFAASQKTKPLPISGSASPSWRSSGFPLSSWGVAAYTTRLTWMRGSKNISVEGGPERSIFHGP